jgi:hypothetical protein
MHIRTNLLLYLNRMIFPRINLCPFHLKVLVRYAIRPVFSWVIEIWSSFKNRNNSKILSYYETSAVYHKYIILYVVSTQNLHSSLNFVFHISSFSGRLGSSQHGTAEDQTLCTFILWIPWLNAIFTLISTESTKIFTCLMIPLRLWGVFGDTRCSQFWATMTCDVFNTVAVFTTFYYIRRCRALEFHRVLLEHDIRSMCVFSG